MSPLNWQDASSAKAQNSLISSLSNPWFAISLGLFGFILGYAFANGIGTGAKAANPGSPTVVQVPSQPTPAAPTAPVAAQPAGDVPPIDLEKDHIRGDPDAEIAVIEYSDYQCPFCTRVHPTLKQVIQTYGDKVMWVYRHYPLPFHPNAEPAAQAAECANELGGNDAFWTFTDKVFEGGSFDFTAIAKDIGLDAAKFQACTASGKYKELVQAQMAGGSAAGVDGTPGNIVYNLKTRKSQMVSGAQPLSAFDAAITAVSTN